MPHFHYTSIKPINPNDEGLEDVDDKRQRIKKELLAVGVTPYYGILKFNSRFLYKIMHDNEHVKGVIYGRFIEGPGFLKWVDRMVIATDRRIISINHKPFMTEIDEFTYDIIDGLTALTAGHFTAITLNTKVGHFTIRFINKLCADIFVHYVEGRRMEYFEGKAKNRQALYPEVD